MRFEALHLLLIGTALFAAAWLASRFIASERLRNLAVSAGFACGLGIGVFPGHGEFIVVPVLAMFAKGGAVAGIGACFAAAWFALAVMLMSSFAKYSRRPAQAEGRTR